MSLGVGRPKSGVNSSGQFIKDAEQVGDKWRRHPLLARRLCRASAFHFSLARETWPSNWSLARNHPTHKMIGAGAAGQQQGTRRRGRLAPCHGTGGTARTEGAKDVAVRSAKHTSARPSRSVYLDALPRRFRADDARRILASAAEPLHQAREGQTAGDARYTSPVATADYFGPQQTGCVLLVLHEKPVILYKLGC